jgi:hypothetical protein
MQFKMDSYILKCLVNLKKTEIIESESYNLINKIYYCNICKKYSTPFRYSITRHVTSHNRIFKYKCNKCFYMSNEKSHLDRHKKSCKY